MTAKSSGRQIALQFNSLICGGHRRPFDGQGHATRRPAVSLLYKRLRQWPAVIGGAFTPWGSFRSARVVDICGLDPDFSPVARPDLSSAPRRRSMFRTRLEIGQVEILDSLIKFLEDPTNWLLTAVGVFFVLAVLWRAVGVALGLADRARQSRDEATAAVVRRTVQELTDEGKLGGRR